MGNNNYVHSFRCIGDFSETKPYILDEKEKRIACDKYFHDKLLNTLYPSINSDNDTFYKILGGKEKYGEAFKNKRVFKFLK